MSLIASAGSPVITFMWIKSRSSLKKSIETIRSQSRKYKFLVCIVPGQGTSVRQKRMPQVCYAQISAAIQSLRKDGTYNAEEPFCCPGQVLAGSGYGFVIATRAVNRADDFVDATAVNVACATFFIATQGENRLPIPLSAASNAGRQLSESCLGVNTTFTGDHDIAFLHLLLQFESVQH